MAAKPHRCYTGFDTKVLINQTNILVYVFVESRIIIQIAINYSRSVISSMSYKAVFLNLEAGRQLPLISQYVR